MESGAFETSLAIRHTINPEEKGRIAAALITEIDEAQTIFIDEGSQTQLIAQRLPAPRAVVESYMERTAPNKARRVAAVALAAERLR